MASKDPAVYLLHIRDCCVDLIEGGEAHGRVPEKFLYQAACRCLEIIGEAAKKLGPEFHAAHPDVAWRQMIATRNLLIHDYNGVESEKVWAIVQDDIPALLGTVNQVLERIGETR